ncbi:MAG TPA: hypothetical protein VNZ53_31720 [Steroidobacteraceae bacterium]|jgi:hypothetical protein|nr:hypothetical protein [Steroidobacteraceae bacterium]
MTAIDPGDLEVPKWMTLAQAVNILQPRIRNADCRQVLLDAIEDGKIEIRQATPHDGVVPLPARANLHLKPDYMDWANSQVIVNRILYEPGAHASDAMLPIRISHADFMQRFKQLFNDSHGSEQAGNETKRDRRQEGVNQGGRPGKADWPALRVALRTEIEMVGFPTKEGVPGWRTNTDVAIWLSARLSDDEDVSPRTMRDRVSRMLSELKEELGRN